MNLDGGTFVAPVVLRKASLQKIEVGAKSGFVTAFDHGDKLVTAVTSDETVILCGVFKQSREISDYAVAEGLTVYSVDISDVGDLGYDTADSAHGLGGFVIVKKKGTACSVGNSGLCIEICKIFKLVGLYFQLSEFVEIVNKKAHGNENRYVHDGAQPEKTSVHENAGAYGLICQENDKKNNFKDHKQR